MVLPASADAPARRVTSSSFQAVGRGGSLTDMQFDGDVVYREETIGGTPRVARATALSLEVAAGGVLTRAVFTGGTTFEDGTLGARAAEARYEPGRGALALSGTDARGEPSVEDEDVVIDARAIAIALEARRIEADGSVKTSLLPGSRRSTGAPVGAANPESSGAAGLLAPGEVARVTADALVYDGAAGTARYSGRVRLWQTQTDLRADTMDIHLATGDLTARGSARATLALDGDRSEGEAHAIVYVDAERRVTYAAAPDAAGGRPAAPARLTGPLGDLRAGRISVFLAEADGRVARLEGEGGVDALLDGRRVTGAHLTYRASDERYVVTGSPTSPVRVRVTEPCREMLGGTLIYSRSADTMHVDGSEVSRTQTTRGGSCQ
jgi:lipopolysaccharide export system protein LptA